MSLHYLGKHEHELRKLCLYLGIIIDSDISWKEHIDLVYKKIIKLPVSFIKYELT